MSDPYAVLGEQLLAAAHRQPNQSAAPERGRPARRRRVEVAIAVLVLVLASATITLARSGLFDGSPVKPHGGTDPNALEGVPLRGGSTLLGIRAADPQGGPPWGMRVVHTTRGDVCVQVGRVLRGELGELGGDRAFVNDGLFHPLRADVLPTNGPQSANTVCVLEGEIFTAVANIDRNAAHTEPVSAVSSARAREVSFGLLGPRALDITYHGPSRVQSAPLSPGLGAYLIVRSANSGTEERVGTGFASLRKHRPPPLGALSAITYKFGDLLCSDGSGARVKRTCPTAAVQKAGSAPDTHSLHVPLRVTFHSRHGELVDAQLEFTAPYTVASARQLYEVIEPSPAGCGAPGGMGLPLERNIKRGARVQVRLLSPFTATRKCGPRQEIQVRFVNLTGRYPHESVIVGARTLTPPAPKRAAARR